MRPVDGTKHSCQSPGAGQDEPKSTEVRQAKRQSRPGVAAIEYCLLLSMIMMFVIVAVQNLGFGSKGLFQRIATIFASDGNDRGEDDQKAGRDDDDDDRGKGKNDDDDHGKGKGKNDDDDRGKGKGKNDDHDRGKGKGKGKNDDDDRGKGKGKKR